MKTILANRVKEGVNDWLSTGKRLIPILFFLLTLGVGQMWAWDCGWWDTGSGSVTFTVNGTDKTPSTLNRNSSTTADYDLGTVTTSLKVKSAWGKTWGQNNIASMTLYYRVKGRDASSSASYSSANIGFDNNFDTNNQYWENSSINASLNINLAPGNYEIEYYFELTINNNHWCEFTSMNNGGNNYHANFTIPSKNLTISAGAGGSASGSQTGITKGTAYTITATPTAGYAFNGWTKTSGSSSITIADASSATTTVTFNNYSNNATVTANFVAEETHDVTVYYKYGSTTVKTSTTESAVGVTTERTFTAPEIDGYNFYSYTFGTGLTMKSANTTTNPCRFVTKSTGTYSLTTYYNIAPVKMYYGNTSTFANSSYSSMTYDATKKAYYVDVTTNSKPYYFRFDFNTDTKELAGDWSDAGYPNVNEVTANGSKVTCATEVKGWKNKSSLKFDGINGSSIRIWFSYKDKQAWITETTYTVTITNDGNGTTSPASVTAGKNTLSGSFSATANTGYYFKNWTKTSGSVTITNSNVSPTTTKATAASTIQANFNPKWQVLGDKEFGGWTAYGSNLFTGYITADGKSKGYYNITLAANTTYEIQAYDRQASKLYGGTAVQNVYYSTSGFDKPFTLATQTTGKNLYIHTAAAGTYRLEWNLTDKKIAVQYPTSWYITSGQKTEGQDDNAGGSFTALDGLNDVKGGKFVADGASVTFTATPNTTGYTFGGWYSDAACTTPYTAGTNVSFSGEGNTTMVISNIATNQTVYAKFVPNTYTVTLTQTGAGSAGTPSVTASYNTTAPAIASLPTAPQGYAFMGYYTAADGEGSQLVAANGTWQNVTGYTSGGKWIRNGGAELFAYFKQAEITNIAFTQGNIVAPSATVTVTATIEPAPVGPTTICWRVLYSNDNPLDPQPTFTPVSGGTVSFPAHSASGSYKVEATLRKGTGCGGEEIHTFTAPFQVAGDHTVTVQYKCGDVTLQASKAITGKPLVWSTEIIPDEIFGYTFEKWVAGDGVSMTIDGGETTIETGGETTGKAGTHAIQIKAIYDGKLTAKYTKKSIFYFKNTLGWSNVYVNFMSNQYWDGLKGSGNKNNYYSRNNAMSLVPGTTDIYYIEYTGSTSQYITFTSKSQDNAENFWGKNPNVQVVVPTRPNDDGSPQTDFGYHAGTNMFIPLDVKVQTKNTGDGGGADYYNRGYWVVYDPITGKTGYTLEVYNKTDDSSRDTVKVMPFTFNAEGVLEATVDLEAATNYGIKFRRDNGMRYTKNGGTLTNDAEQKFEYHPDNWAACAIKTTAAGDYVFTINCSSSDGSLYLKAHFPAAVNDFQVYYKDNSVTAHPSRMITARASGVDTISFFVDKTKSPMLKARKVNSIDGGEGTITWGALYISGEASQSLSVDSTAVYNFVITQSTAGTIASIENIGAYKGDYYIRCAALNSKWDFYRSDRDHLMTYSSFSESDANAFGEKFSHYKTKWCKYGKNVTFCIANDYSPCISDTLIQDVGNPYNNINEDGFLNDDGNSEETENIYSANIRFMWNRKTNKVSRAYIASSTNASRLFLVLRGNTAIKGLDDSPIEDEGSGIPSVILQDDQNWIYEEVLYIKPNTRFKLYACYAQVTASPNGAQYFRGSYNGNAFSGEDGVDSENSVVLIGGSGETYQKARVLYDFKTNRLICAWLPSSSAIDEEIGINADVMVIREHQEPAQYISFKDEDSKLTGVKTVYGVMKFNRWVLNNRKQTGTHGPLDVGDQKSIYERSLYFVSFPFDVRVGDIFGFGRYWDEWYIEYYDGLNRAKNGYWIDSPPNWKYVTPEMATNYVLKANEGYILGLDLDFMAYDNTTFWAHDIETIELFFPSTTTQGTLEQTNVTIPALSAIEGDPYRCTIDRGTPEGDRRVKDSYWRCLGVPSFNIYNTPLHDGEGNPITWQPDGNTLPFIYMWNKADNTLTAQSTSAFTFLPMHAYLVQNGGEIRWNNVSAKPSSIVARKENDMPATTYEWRLTLNQDSNMVDQTFVRMTNLEQVTDTFDFGQDMSKEFNETRSNLYSFIGYERAAANCLTLNTESNTIIPLGLNIIAGGDYTLAMPDGTNGVGITLVDETTGTRTNLSAGLTYPVTLEKGDYTNRFFLEISPIKTTPTGIEDVQGGNVQSTKVHKVMIDGILYIVKDGKIFDARGARLR